MEEISIVDIPANENAVKLYKKGGKCVYRLSDLIGEQTPDLRIQIIGLLGLGNTVTDSEIIDNIRALLGGAESAEQSVNEAVRLGLIERSQAGNFVAMAKANHTAFKGFISDKRKEQKTQLADMLVTAMKQGKIISHERHIYETVGEHLGTDMVRRIIGCIPDRIKLGDLASGKHRNRTDWGLNEYRKYAPDELKDDPTLYARLLERDGRQMELNAETLDYYRRNKPEYLHAHPEEYQRLIKQ